MKTIEPRIIIAYGIIALMILAAIVGIAYLRHNSARRRYERDRSRAKQRWRDQVEQLNADEDAMPPSRA
ncbi:hypothetical protein [Sphingopyxis sp. L1A2A]|uniref:hypothetical protein n=1 Tax=Sphingopyxis sp. L1A2A TaxID=2502247 RepID=UPI0010F73EBB|nr:hypothetical protein [Sphingopyxis sp. L1A2A]